MIEVTPELLARYDTPLPRYTSYPTAVEFGESFGPESYEARLAAAAERPDAPLSLYVHLPFCQARCSFCACHVVVAKRPEVSDAYLGRIVAEARMVGERLGGKRRLVQYHWGGGTPTHYPPDVLIRLHHDLLGQFELDPGAEVAIEVDPRVTSSGHLEALASAGFNRLSFGVQDLDPEVQRLIGRNQTESQTVTLYEHARRIGFDSINLDLIYGLPGQDETTMAATLDTVLRLRPDRLAVYSFAYVPWMRPHQRRMDETLQPTTEEKFALLAMVITELTAAGYHHIGMDHFALPGDELARAARAGALNRNFMGYTTRRDTEVVALGTSGISDLRGAYAQNHRRLASYYAAVDAGVLPIERGYRLTRDDEVRRHIITELMCNGMVDLAAAAARFGVTSSEPFAPEITRLTAPSGLVDEGMATVEGPTVRATELGRLFIRRIAALFDVRTAQRPGDRPMFSKTV